MILLFSLHYKVAEYGSYNQEDGVFPIMAEIFLRGPVKASINAGPLQGYKGGIIMDSPANRNTTHNHGVSLVGWGHDKSTDIQYWIVRNSVRDKWIYESDVVIVEILYRSQVLKDIFLFYFWFIPRLQTI